MIIDLIKKYSCDPLSLIGMPGVILYMNPETYLFYRNCPQSLVDVRGLRFDGLLFSSLNRFFLNLKTPRRSFDFTSIADAVFSYYVRVEGKVAIYGGSNEDLSCFIKVLKERYPDLNIIDHASGYDFEPDEHCYPELDFILVGMGGVLQDKVAIRLSALNPNAQIMTCGAFISQTAGSGGDYYPYIVNKLNLRFLYRFWREPGQRQHWKCSS